MPVAHVPDLGVDDRRIVEREVERRPRCAETAAAQEHVGQRGVQERHVELGHRVGVVVGVARRVGHDHFAADDRMQLAAELVDARLVEAEAEREAELVVGLGVVGV
jgi:hypothetical protein